MRALRLGLVFALIAFVAAPSAQADYMAQEIGVRFPDAIGGLQRQGEPYRYPQPGLGYSLRYANPNIRVDIYVYNSDQRGIPNGVGGAVAQEFAQANQEIEAFYRQQNQPAQRVGAGTETLGTAPRQTPWLIGRYDVQQGGRAMRSVVMLTGLRGYFVKVRATYPGGGKGNDDPLASFAAELSAVLSSAPAPGGNAPGTK